MIGKNETISHTNTQKLITCYYITIYRYKIRLDKIKFLWYNKHMHNDTLNSDISL